MSISLEITCKVLYNGLANIKYFSVHPKVFWSMVTGKKMMYKKNETVKQRFSLKLTFQILFDFTRSQPGFLSPEVETSNSSGFTVQRGRGVPTLTSVHQSSNSQQQSADLYKSDKEQFNKDTKSDELGEEGDNSLLNQVSFSMK